MAWRCRMAAVAPAVLLMMSNSKQKGASPLGISPLRHEHREIRKVATGHPGDYQRDTGCPLLPDINLAPTQGYVGSLCPVRHSFLPTGCGLIWVSRGSGGWSTLYIYSHIHRLSNPQVRPPHPLECTGAGLLPSSVQATGVSWGGGLQTRAEVGVLQGIYRMPCRSVSESRWERQVCDIRPSSRCVIGDSDLND